MDISAGAVAQFLGALAILFLITHLWSLLVKRFIHRGVALTSSVLSLSTATILGGYGFGNGNAPAFAHAFGLYFAPQLVIFVVLWWRSRSSSNKLPETISVVNHEETPQGGYPSPSVEIDADDRSRHGVRNNLLAPPESQRKRRSNFVARYWRGELSLAASYWGVNLLVGLVAIALAIVLTAFFSVDEGFEPVPIFWYTFLLWLGIAVLTVWQIVGLWRSATNHAERRRNANRPVFWAGAAKFAAVLGAIQTIGAFTQNAAPQIGEMYKIAFEGDPDIPESELKLLDGGRELSVFGGIKFGLANDVERILDAAPDVSTIHLTSTGGRIAEAHKIYKLLKVRNLDTYASNECSSACTLIFAAGSKRSLLQGAKLGYHGLAFPGLTGEERLSATQEWADVYREAGLNASFVTKALAFSSDTMWYPTADELLRANAITGVVSGEDFAVSGHEIGPTLASVERDMRAASGIVDALHTAAPEIAHELYASTRAGIVEGKSNAQLRENVSKLLIKAVVDNLVRADDVTLAEYAGLLSAQYSALKAKDPALCYQYAALGTNEQVVDSLPPGLVSSEEELNEKVLRTAAERPEVNPEDNEMAWALIVESMTPEQAEIVTLPPEKVPPSKYDQYCDASIIMFEGIGNLGTKQAAMLMREMFSSR